MEWETWTYVVLAQRSQLPAQPGIYVVVDNDGKVLYVGQSTNLNARWNAQSHHRYKQLSRTNKKRLYKIYWKTFPSSQLDEREQIYINIFRPTLNYTKVKSYSRPLVQPKQEIKRILKVINKKTQLFRTIRSVVLGFYKDTEIEDDSKESQYTCIVIAVHVNDHDKIILKSCDKSTKRKGIHLQDCWKVYYADCGGIDSPQEEISIVCFVLGNFVYEFVTVPDLLFELCKYPSALQVVQLETENVLAIKDMEVLSELHTIDAKLIFTGEKYLRYRYPDLQCISHLVSG